MKTYTAFYEDIIKPVKLGDKHVDFHLVEEGEEVEGKNYERIKFLTVKEFKEGTHPTDSNRKQRDNIIWIETVVAELPELAEGEIYSPLSNELDISGVNPIYVTQRFEAVEAPVAIPLSAPKYLIVAILEEKGFVNVVTQVEATIAAIPDSKLRRKAELGWQMQSDVRRDNEIVALLKADVSKPDGSPLTDVILNKAFIEANE